MHTTDDTPPACRESNIVSGPRSSLDSTGEPLPWMNIFETGIKTLDACHRQLVVECNEVMALNPSGLALDEIVARAGALVANCISHFDVEEELMQKLEFPRVEQHVVEHTRMRSELPRLVSTLAQAGSDKEMVGQSLDALRFALIELLVRYDLDYRPHLLSSQGR